MALSATANRVIELAAAVRAYWDAELPKRHPDYPLTHEGEDSGPPPPEEGELLRLLRSLSTEEVFELLALAFLGRGDFPAPEFKSRWRAFAQNSTGPEEAIARMIETPPLADYLLDGLQEVAAAGIDIDHPGSSAA